MSYARERYMYGFKLSKKDFVSILEDKKEYDDYDFHEAVLELYGSENNKLENGKQYEYGVIYKETNPSKKFNSEFLDGNGDPIIYMVGFVYDQDEDDLETYNKLLDELREKLKIKGKKKYYVFFDREPLY